MTEPRPGQTRPPAPNKTAQSCRMARPEKNRIAGPPRFRKINPSGRLALKIPAFSQTPKHPSPPRVRTARTLRAESSRDREAARPAYRTDDASGTRHERDRESAMRPPAVALLRRRGHVGRRDRKWHSGWRRDRTQRVLRHARLSRRRGQAQAINIRHCRTDAPNPCGKEGGHAKLNPVPAPIRLSHASKSSGLLGMSVSVAIAKALSDPNAASINITLRGVGLYLAKHDRLKPPTIIDGGPRLPPQIRPRGAARGGMRSASLKDTAMDET